MLVRPARATDAEHIRQIYNAAVSTPFTFDLRPRSLAEQEAWLAQRAGAYATIVAVDGGPAEGEVVGFASLSPYRSRPAYSTTVEDSVYVREDQRGRGVGRLLLTELLEVAEGHGFHSVMARIVGQNEPSIALHRAVGFELVGVEREVGRKFRRWLDVVAMQKLFTAPGATLDAPADD
jgi:phosphinothricin acetyltransferase